MKIKTKSNKVNKQWLQDHANDPYVKLAQREGFRARAAYKLSEIDEQFKLLRPGQLVVDLGSTPGAWSQYIRRKFAPKAGAGGGAAVGELNGRIVSGQAAEPDTLVASARAYLNAYNRLLMERDAAAQGALAG